jgi:hypothetical protein
MDNLCGLICLKWITGCAPCRNAGTAWLALQELSEAQHLKPESRARGDEAQMCDSPLIKVARSGWSRNSSSVHAPPERG